MDGAEAAVTASGLQGPSASPRYKAHVFENTHGGVCRVGG